MELVLTRDHRRGARNASATIPDAPRSDPPDPADAIDAALLIPLLGAAAARWRASVAPDVQLYPDPPEKAALGRPCRPAAINEIRTA